MGASGLWARAEWRRRWQGLVALGAGVGIAGAVVLTALAGAERTSSSYDRFVAATARSDVLVQDDADGAPVLARIPDLPGIAAADRLLFTFGPARAGDETLEEFTLVASEHDRFTREFDRPILREGRVPDRPRPTEILLNEHAADGLGVGVGDVVSVHTLTEEQFFSAVFGGGPSGEPAGPVLELTVTAVGKLPDDLDAPDPAGVVAASVFASHPDVGRFDNQVWARLDGGQDAVDELIAAVRQLPEHEAGNVYFTRADDANERVIDAIAVQRVSLLAFALVALLVATIVTGQAVLRQVVAGSDDGAVLTAIGLDRSGRAVALTIPFVGVAVVATLLALVGASATSVLLPTGFARRAEPDPGLDIDLAILVPGALTLLAFVVAVALVSAIAATRPARGVTPGPERPWRLGAWAAALGARPAALTGLRLALSPSTGRARLPVRSTLTGVAVGVAGLAAVMTFGAGLDDVLTDHSLYGWTWDANVAAPDDDPAAFDATVAELARAPGVEAITVADIRIANVEGVEVPTVALRPVRGATAITYLEGRPPTDVDEIALGPEVLDRAGTEVGQEVELPGDGGGALRMRVVGSPLLPLEEGHSRVAIVTEDGLQRIERSEGFRDLLVDTDGEPEAVLDGVTDAPITGPELPTSIANLREARGVPTALAAFLAALVLAALAHALLLGLRRRRRELGVLRAMGLMSRQVNTVVAVQATTISVLGALIGLPIGVAAGRRVWEEFADGLDVVVRVEVPVAAVCLVGVGLVVTANLVGVVRAAVARRATPAAALRTAD